MIEARQQKKPIPPREECEHPPAELWPCNVDAARTWTYVQDQLTNLAGGMSEPMFVLNYQSVAFVWAMYPPTNERDCFEKVLAIFNKVVRKEGASKTSRRLAEMKATRKKVR